SRRASKPVILREVAGSTRAKAAFGKSSPPIAAPQQTAGFPPLFDRARRARRPDTRWMGSSSPLRRPFVPRLPALRWPLPALLAWATGWVTMLALLHSSAAPPVLAVAIGLVVAALPALFATTFWRRVIVAAGFPVSLLATGVGGVLPAWAWLVPLAALTLAYPVTAWRDAPVFPTPRDALAGLDQLIALEPGASVHDAGCGLGHGLRALRAVWPQAHVSGIEWSWPLALATRLRCPWARVARGDMWRGSWAAHDLVYLFQRPESMARALAKAHAEMRPGSWLVSLEFEAAGNAPHAQLRMPSGRPVWVYRVEGEERPTRIPDRKRPQARE
ncbi:MAG: hypothetical protein ABI907_10875, partial [Ramlibacter sp.]